MKSPLEPGALRNLDAYWRAANCLSVAQIYLRSNPLLRQPLQRSDVKTLWWASGARCLGRTSSTRA